MKNNQNSNDPCKKFQFPCFISISSCNQSNCCTPVFFSFSQQQELLSLINRLNQAILSLPRQIRQLYKYSNLHYRH